MQLRLEWTALPAAVLLLSLAGCSDGAQPTAVALPAAARALAVSPDFAGTLWETTGAGAWRSHDGGLSWKRVHGPGGLGQRSHARVCTAAAGRGHRQHGQQG